MGLMEMFADPTLFDQLSQSDKLVGSAITAIMGMGTTFAVLIIIWVLIALMAKIVSGSEKKKSEKEAALVSASSPSVAPTAVPLATNVNAGAGADLVAVIAAAIAAYEGNGATPDNFVVRRIVRLAGPAQAWDNAGRREALESRF